MMPATDCFLRLRPITCHWNSSAQHFPRRTRLPVTHFDNVLCETVVMHLPPDEVTEGCARLLDVLRPAGMLYLSWRVVEGALRATPPAGSILHSMRRVSGMASALRTSCSMSKRLTRPLASAYVEWSPGGADWRNMLV
jgi:hypothetical protein